MYFPNIKKREVGHLAQKIAFVIEKGDIILLNGELGTGKTYFSSQLCKHLGVKTQVNSPSYILLNEYQGNFLIFHYDLFRLSKAEEALELGIMNRLNDGITIIEWANVIKSFLPQNYLEILFEYSTKFRDITIQKYWNKQTPFLL